VTGIQTCALPIMKSNLNNFNSIDVESHLIDYVTNEYLKEFN